MKSAILRLAAVSAIALTGVAPAVSAPPPPTAPTNVKIDDVKITSTTASFTIKFTPARNAAGGLYPTYQFSIAPKFCTFTEPRGTGNFPTKTFAGPPYQVSVVCSCNRTYTAAVSTHPPDAYTPRSAWIVSPAVPMACVK